MATRAQERIERGIIYKRSETPSLPPTPGLVDPSNVDGLHRRLS